MSAYRQIKLINKLESMSRIGSTGSGTFLSYSTCYPTSSSTELDGGRKGTDARATKQQEALANAEHVGATVEQQKYFELAAMDRSLYSKLDNAKPAVAATSHAGVLDAASITHSTGGPPNRSAESGEATTGVDSK